MAALFDFYFSPSVASAQHFYNAVIEREKNSIPFIANCRQKAVILRFRGRIFTEYVIPGEKPRQGDAVWIGSGTHEEVINSGEIF